MRSFQSVQEERSENCWNGCVLQMFAQLPLSGTSWRCRPLSRSAHPRHDDTHTVSGVFPSEVTRRPTSRSTAGSLTNTAV